MLRANHLLTDSLQNNLSASKLKPENIQKHFCIKNHNVEVKSVEADIIGNLVGLRPQATNIFKGLRSFFRRNRRSCLFRCEAILLLIWKSNGNFYVFDSNGRTECCVTDADKGFASLICVGSLTNIACLIVQMSDLKASDFFVISELQMKQLSFNEKDYEISKNIDVDNSNPYSSFMVLSEHFAIVQGTLNVSNNCFKSTRNLQSLAVCCVANIYNLIHPPNSWTSKVVDKVIMLGDQMYKDCTKYDLPEEFTIDNIPQQLSIGTYNVKLRIIPYQRGGQLQHSSNHSMTDLMLELENFFIEYSCALLQVDHLMLVIWKRDTVYYLFDPYARGKSGEVIHVRGPPGAACLHMHSTLSSLCTILYENLMKIAEKEIFYLHSLLTSITPHDSNNVNNNTNNNESKNIETDSKSLNESIDDAFMPKLNCKPKKSSMIYSMENNLDSPAVSDTQFIRPWHIIKNDLYGEESLGEGTENNSGKSKKKK